MRTKHLLFLVQGITPKPRANVFAQWRNQNSLLMIRRIYDFSPGAVTGGKLVPSFHKR